MTAALRAPEEALTLGSALFMDAHMQLGDRMADEDAQPAESWRRRPAVRRGGREGGQVAWVRLRGVRGGERAG